MRFLYITTVGATMEFFVPVIRELLARGHQVDIACNEMDNPVPDIYRQWNCKVHPISCTRYPLNQDNWLAIRQIRELAEAENYDIIHCHTPIAAAFTRLACRRVRKTGTKIFYTAHGFHFYKGAPLLNWLLYYPIEKLCAGLTDVLITINQEDYELAKRRLKAKSVEYVPGVGIDLDVFHPSLEVSENKRRELVIPEDAVVLLTVGELSQRKNQQILLQAAADIPELYVVIAGSGPRESELKALAEQLGIKDRVKLLGYRKDIPELCAMCDIFALPSLQEGLPVALMEAMASGKTVVCSRIRGNVDLMGTQSELFFDPFNIEDCRKAILRAMQCDRAACGKDNREKVRHFAIGNVVDRMLSLYKS